MSTLNAKQSHARNQGEYISGSRSYDYREKYEDDAEKEWLAENARVWKVYLDEAELKDNELLAGFKDTIDALLIFAALFSAVVTSFIISTITSLQPNYTQITAVLMVEQINLLRAAGNLTAINTIPNSNVNLEMTTPGTKDLWINGLFLASLLLSLATALLSVLVKQWLQAYTAISSGNAREQAMLHQFKYSGLIQWKVPEIIGTLPLILHTSLGLFFIGLSLQYQFAFFLA
ncbi:hypothetical protein F5878DRAFT_697896 [Lentinula raphanica]|uniref:DUF6535 domain-containing protein n=1 Tax=Lentinula raphanica TaxID=153919 RepID=A0AA38P0E2_9AGAR|nr:hypothetical protein F5880DRAFT_1625963 [Lentinula raphanica]KAJ3833936.1 hypothetical protein F5878DRAFT_697896 [Lentinula raphanica]